MQGPVRPIRKADELPEQERKRYEQARSANRPRIRKELEQRGCPEILRGDWESILVHRAALDEVNRERGAADVRMERDAWEMATTKGWMHADRLK